ncbi:hypothetical protein CHS0354_017486 [Potamilus streckersoni]|uniref:Uncharacterized protein n=1 Tax=Potamilus streckersoni TaxID=2493646 RepID=A0AAE0SZ57_9BIVA|nr:hypothetical protein CHS0354_017486 [Potamilus streckersoni]
MSCHGTIRLECYIINVSSLVEMGAWRRDLLNTTAWQHLEQKNICCKTPKIGDVPSGVITLPDNDRNADIQLFQCLINVDVHDNLLKCNNSLYGMLWKVKLRWANLGF